MACAQWDDAVPSPGRRGSAGVDAGAGVCRGCAQLKTGPTYIQLEGYKEQLGGSWGWVWVAAGAWFDPANLGGAELEQPWSMSL